MSSSACDVSSWGPLDGLQLFPLPPAPSGGSRRPRRSWALEVEARRLANRALLASRALWGNTFDA
eukprot:11453610-Alexandrium_andersonii.AAC.1